MVLSYLYTTLSCTSVQLQCIFQVCICKHTLVYLVYPICRRVLQVIVTVCACRQTSSLTYLMRLQVNICSALRSVESGKFSIKVSTHNIPHNFPLVKNLIWFHFFHWFASFDASFSCSRCITGNTQGIWDQVRSVERKRSAQKTMAQDDVTGM